MNVEDEANSSYFVLKGFLKYFLIDQNGKEIIYNFRQEQMTVTGYSFYNSNRPLFNVICMEDCRLISIPNEAFEYVSLNFKNGPILRYLLAESHIIELVKLSISKDSKSILQRYYNLDNEFPNIHQRIAQSTIAIFLGITEEYLSRLKKGLIKRKNI